MVRTLEGSKVEDDEKVAADLLVVKLRRRFEDSSTLPARPADGGDWQLGDLTRLSPRIGGICSRFVSYFFHGCQHLVPFDILNVGFPPCSNYFNSVETVIRAICLPKVCLKS